MADHIAKRLHKPGPKRILALDGGGVRGAITLAFLEQIETTLRNRLETPDLVLADYFDLIGGTSVGSMFATLLAAGKDVAYVRERFETWAPRIFDPKTYGILEPKFDARVLRGLVQSEIFDQTLGSGALKTGLCIIAKRVDTGSVWCVINNPSGPYFAARKADGNRPERLGNGDYKLLDLIRASTAAPRFFSPLEIGIFDGVDEFGNPGNGRFVDGAVSPHNSPALQLFMMAGIRGYNLGGGPIEPRGERRAWPLGDDKLFIVSVGTGTYRHSIKRSSVMVLDAINALQGMISDGQELGLTLLQWMSIPRRNWHIDRVVGDLSNDLLGDGAGLERPLLSFHRYDVRLDRDWLLNDSHCGVDVSEERLELLRDFTNSDAVSELYKFAETAARIQVTVDDFPAAFDNIWRPSGASQSNG